MRLFFQTICLAVTIALASTGQAGTVDFDGPATGYLAISNFKNSSTQNGIEGKDAQ